MPWTTPSLKDLRKYNRDFITGALQASAMVPNSVTRVVADANAGLAHLCMLFIAWAARQFLPDTAEVEWLDRHGTLWLKNADGSKGRKTASLATGFMSVTGISGTLLPIGSQVGVTTTEGIIDYETTEDVIVASVPTDVPIRALDPGAAGNLDPGTFLTFTTAVSGVNGSATVVQLLGGADEETDDDLRDRVLERIQQPPMGGADHDYVAWAKQVPAVTRAWTGALEMGMGTVTLRFMMDDLRADLDGFPTPTDVEIVKGHLDTQRPVAVKDFFCFAPVPQPIDMIIISLATNDPSTRQAIEDSLHAMLKRRAFPGQTVYRSWVDEAISEALGEEHHELTYETTLMPSKGHMASLGTITYGE